MTNPDELAALLGRVSQRHAVPLPVLLTLVQAIVKGAPAPESAVLERRLSRRAQDVLRLRQRLARPVEDAALARWRAQASAALEAGQFTELDKALAQAELHLLSGLSDLSQMPQDRRLAFGEARADRGLTGLIDLAPQACMEAAQRFAEASAIIGLADVDRAHAVALEQGDALLRLGEDFGDRAGYDAAITHLRNLVAGLDNFDETVRFAATHERLGTALEELGALTGDGGPGLQALESYRAALDDLRREQAPALWIRLQRRLGRLALTRGEAETGTDLVEEAVTALRAAAAATDKATSPADWTGIQRILGRALAVLGERTGGMAELEAAFNAFNSTLTLWTREHHPLRWAEMQDRMGLVLCAMGDRYSEPVVLEEAIAAFQRALEIRLRETHPLLWAASAGNRGLATLQLAQRKKDRALAQQGMIEAMAAVEAMRAGQATASAAALQARLVEASSWVK